MKIILEYDERVGALTDKNGMTLYTDNNIQHYGIAKTVLDVQQIVDLKNAGFSGEDITDLKLKGII